MINERIININSNDTKTYNMIIGEESTEIVGVLPVSQGGTNMTTYNIGDLIVAIGSTELSVIPAFTAGYVLISNGVNTPPIYSIIDLTVHITGVLPAINGGTGNSSYTVGDILYASTTTSLSKLSDIAVGNVLISNGIGIAPSYDKLNMSNSIIGTLGISNGGTNLTSYTIGDLIYASGATTLSKLADIATGNALLSGGTNTAPSYGKVNLVTATTGTLLADNGGTGISSYTTGDLIYASGTTTLSKLSAVATGNALLSGGIGVAPSYGKIDLTTTVTGSLPVGNGGTGQSTFTIGDIIYAPTTTTLNKLADIATGNALISGGVNTAPSYGKIGLSTHVTGILPITNGGLGFASYAVGDIVYASGTTTLSKLADVATGNVLLSGGVGVAPSYGKVNLTTAVTGVLPYANGGTNASSLSTGLIYSTGSAFASLSGITASKIVQYRTTSPIGLSYQQNNYKLMQLLTNITSSVITCTGVVNFDNNVPLATAGSSIMGISITPTSASNIIIINAVCSGGGTTDGFILLTSSLSANALTVSNMSGTGTFTNNGKMIYQEIAGSTSIRTYTLRAGVSGVSTVYINATSAGSGLYSTSYIAYLEIAEYATQYI